MTEPLMALVLLAAILALSIGGAKLVSWLLDRRDHAASQRSREAQAIALAKAEIAATKRGDLLAAARRRCIAAIAVQRCIRPVTSSRCQGSFGRRCPLPSL